MPRTEAGDGIHEDGRRCLSLEATHHIERQDVLYPVVAVIIHGPLGASAPEHSKPSRPTVERPPEVLGGITLTSIETSVCPPTPASGRFGFFSRDAYEVLHGSG